MLKKENEVHQTKEARQSFSKIKEVLQAAPVLISSDYQNPFQIFSFASLNSIATILLQKNDEGKEKPVAFFSKVLRDAELKHNILEKHVYALVKAIKSFRTYVLQSQIIAYVPNAAVEDVLVQSDVEGKRGKWIAQIQEYDLDINPTKLVKGQGLEKMLTWSNFQALGINLLTLVNEEIIKEGEEKSNPGMKI